MFTFITLYLLVEKILAWPLVTGIEKKQEGGCKHFFLFYRSMKQYEAPERKLCRDGLWSYRVGFCEYKNKYMKGKKKKKGHLIP